MIRHLIILYLAVFPIMLFGFSEPQQLLGQPIREHAHWVNKTYGLRISSQGVSMPDGPVRAIFLSVSGDRKLSIEEARGLIILCVEDLLSRINKDRALRPWLLDYPFTPINLAYTIGLDSSKTRKKNSLFLSDVLMAGNEIVYSIWDFELDLPEEIYRERYVDGLAKFKNQQATRSSLTVP